MLSNLASYLMGGAPTVPAAGSSPTPSTAPTEVAQGPVIAHQELRCTEEEDWLLVDPDAANENSLQGNGGRCSGGTTTSSSDRSTIEGEVPSGSQRGTAAISIKRRNGGRCWSSNGQADRAVSNDLDSAVADDDSDNRHHRNRSRSRSCCSSSSGGGGGGGRSCHRMEQGGDTGTSEDEESLKGGEEDSENCAPSSGLEESWYVAPSACIARRRPVKLATSPLENLLIEHPSMSVYHHSLTEDAMQSPSSSPVTIEEADEDHEPSADEEMMEMVGQLRPCAVKRQRRPFPPSNPAKEKQFRGQQGPTAQAAGNSRKHDLTAPCTATPTVPHLKSQKVSLEAAMLGGRVSQKKDRTNRSQLDRLNKCRSSSNQKKLRRSDRQNSNKNSFANNNRKSSCQRMS